MEDKSTTKDLAAFLIIIGFFAVLIGGLKMYDLRTNKLQEIGETLVSRFIRD